MNDICYKILMYVDSAGGKGKVTVVEMQWFDEHDYNPNDFVKDTRGRSLEFDSEEEAVQWVFSNVKEECIDPELFETFRFNQNDFLK
ncbi:hypothetical protein SP3_00062 [Bacillus phage fHSPT3]